MNLKSNISIIIKTALDKCDISADVVINESTKAEFGDYQYNGIMPLAKVFKQNPREISKRVVSQIEIGTIISKVEVAGPGFINIFLNRDWLSENANLALKDDRLSISKTDKPLNILIDYSGPNMAKEMHVGHLRSTIIGDSLANLSEFLGHNVIRQNHVGDWGTQFGMLIAYLEDMSENSTDNLKDLEQFYKDAKKRFDEDKNFADKAREYVVKIQSGDKHCLELWKQFIDISLYHCEDVYNKLGVSLTRDDVKAESFYNNELDNTIKSLEDKSLIDISDGAKCIFFEDSDSPMIIQKKDGGYLYATTDLAAIRYRVDTLKADKILYVVDARQSLHFKQLFEIASKANFTDNVVLEHIAFGTMMDKSGRPFKTRDGGTVKLVNLLDESILKAKNSIDKREEYSHRDIEKIAETVGIGAVKYADLSINRESNYIFDWDKMLSFDGNTALYLQYGYVRIKSILKKYDGDIDSCNIIVGDDLEQKLVLTLLKFEDILDRVYIQSKPHILTLYLYDLTTLFMRFYEQNPILRDDIAKDIQKSRLAIASLSAKTIKQGLKILGIEVVDRL
jgi:arginyl-tRNA synthetase